MAHTPGPWAYDGDSQEVYGTAEKYGSGWIARVVGNDSDGRPFPDEERLANARLIAAAPDLLAACVAIAKDIRRLQFTDGEVRLSERSLGLMLELLEREIDKAMEGTNGKERSLD